MTAKPRLAVSSLLSFSFSSLHIFTYLLIQESRLIHEIAYKEWRFSERTSKKKITIGSNSSLNRTSAIYTRRVVRQYGICWYKDKLSWGLGTLHIFFRNKTFLFVKIESWNFQHLFYSQFQETSQNQTDADSLDAENFSFLSWQTKKFCS